MIKRTLLVISLLLLPTGCGEVPAACDRQCGEIRALFTAPCGSQHSGTPAECARWVAEVGTMTRLLDESLQGKPVQDDVSEVLPRLMTAVGDFENLRCGAIDVDNLSSTDSLQAKCNEALIATRGDLGSLYFSAEVPD
ncbi:hypothetical protein [Lentzea sp. HUAS12]|uniref:hypothetical protein n=1 Tax=Lentzea sp. HUAS12 TaxID=2951806 RepID=UPI0020A0AB33|nr:hypothetical protein [Lentzea sp. HUAS12]USX49215.1 hypothetical protein ND450_27675 [Lentzea sp. HUAS12]